MWVTMASKKRGKNSWEDLNFIKRKTKKRKTEEKLKKADSISKDKEFIVNEEKNTNETCTLSIAVPGSILDNAQSPELRTYLAGQLARAACIYEVDEVLFKIFQFDLFIYMKYKINLNLYLDNRFQRCR